MLPARHNDWMPDIFNDFFDTNWMDRPKATAPAINVIETPEVNVHLDEEGDLVINMEKKVENKEKEHKGHYLRREFSYTKFQQTMLLPEDANREDIAAKVEHGVLTVTIAKVKKIEPEKVRKQIEVQ